VWRHPGHPQASQETLGQGTGGEGHGVEALQRLLEDGVDRQIGWDLTGVDEPVFSGRQPVSCQTRVAKTSGQGISGELGEVAQCGHTQPAEGVDQLIGLETLPQSSQIEIR
jgi:hypothetical protein